jgi:hypothetical protein
MRVAAQGRLNQEIEQVDQLLRTPEGPAFPDAIQNPPDFGRGQTGRGSQFSRLRQSAGFCGLQISRHAKVDALMAPEALRNVCSIGLVAQNHC